MDGHPLPGPFRYVVRNALCVASSLTDVLLAVTKYRDGEIATSAEYVAKIFDRPTPLGLKGSATGQAAKEGVTS